MKCFLTLLYIFSFLLINAHPEDKLFQHPRGLITPYQQEKIRERVKREPYISMFNKIKETTKRIEQRNKEEQDNKVYRLANLAKHQSFMYVMTNDSYWADKAYLASYRVLQDSNYVMNPLSFGLTRAAVLRDISIVYDFCFHAWTYDQRENILDGLFALITSVSSNMGYHANYELASNWMGVRWGSVAFASCVWDDYEVLRGKRPRSRAIPFIWDAKKRLEDQIEANVTKNGWNVESMGYHGYDWSFVGPALIALQNNHSQPELSEYLIENIAPDALNSVYAISTSTISIENKGNLGIKADLADDNPMSGYALYAIALRLYPEEQLPAIKWMHDYLFDPDVNSTSRGAMFYSIAYYPENIESVNPENYGWLNYADKEKGVLIYRNRFKNENDIVATYNINEKLYHGHRGPDNLSFRLIGLGSLWAVGAGRTSRVAGQTNLFPHKHFYKIIERDKTGHLLDYKFYRDGSGYALAKGSCLDVKNHVRYFNVDYSSGSGAEAVVIVSDTSSNGSLWRLNTPEFNKIRLQDSGFILTAPNGATLKATVHGVPYPLQIDTGRVLYGGTVKKHNVGIWYNDSIYRYNNWIDIHCNKDIIVTMTLQPAGRQHPYVRSIPDEAVIKVGEKGYLIQNKK